MRAVKVIIIIKGSLITLHLNLRSNSHPTNITQIVNIFSASVLGATLPNPTDVNDVNVKYSAVT